MDLELDTPFMQARIADGVGWMMFNNPDRRNALKMEMNRAIATILDEFERSDDVRVAVMYGAGDKAFVSGADISEFETHRSTPQARAEYDHIAGGADRAFRDFSKPLIAMIRGFCMGGGLATALQADLRVSSDDGQFAIPAARLGVGYGFGGIDKLTHIVGPTMAAEIMLTARRFTAVEAHHMGLLNSVVASGELESTVTEMANTIAANAPLTVKLAKACVKETFISPAQQELGRLAEMVETCFSSRDYQEGRRAFMEKRSPDFKGH